MSSIKRSDILKFFKSQKIVTKIDSTFIIKEEQKGANLKEVEIIIEDFIGEFWLFECDNLDKNAIYEMKFAKVDKVLLYLQDDILKIFLFELKSKTFKETQIREKFKNSLMWVLAMTFLNIKDNQKIDVYGIVPSLNPKDNKNENISIFDSKRIPIKIKHFSSDSETLQINLKEII